MAILQDEWRRIPVWDIEISHAAIDQHRGNMLERQGRIAHMLDDVVAGDDIEAILETHDILEASDIL